MSLSGKTLVITRDETQAKPFAQKLEALGATILLFPTIKITEPDYPDQIRKLVHDPVVYDWIIFTSANAVRYFMKYLNNSQKSLEKVNISCVGKKTAEILKKFNVTPALIPEKYSSDELFSALLKHDLHGKRILLPVSNLAGKELQKALQERGALVERIVVYKNVPNEHTEKEKICHKIENNEIDCIIFFSPSAIDTFAQLMEEKGIELIKKRNVAIAVIGSTTARAARKNDLNPVIIPEMSDELSFINELKKYFRVED